ncbi:hypothetical protein CA85_02380 [Allorhodopirellula solitaria]|uniref:Uncharacterized protein n=2 Tax=Allorhodopirellula solitaria TaxID=2527987 RepID=A0A5C5YJB3_9BACT|nr:hypothetical protein CA85_02380 [Allorhodopirellula solitaria]
MAGVFLLTAAIAIGQDASVLSVMPAGQSPPDARLGELKTLNGHFPFRVPETKAAWQARADQLRQTILVSTGLSPLPKRTPLNAVIHGKLQRDGFTIERVYFESLPGHFVTGLLFRPDGDSTENGNPTDGKYPAILSPHGHGGRMQRYSDGEIQQKIEAGAERFVDSGQTPKLARCVQLARMGCVTFIFDMLGYGDSLQISRETVHRHAELRREDKRPTDGSLPTSWPLFSIDADLRLQSVMGLQTWNAIRSLDFLASLPDVDPQRLGMTGGSGGGTQAILLGAIDPRVKVSFPNGMVSTSMQGGCYCENCSLLRVDTGNVELAALMAPRPMACTAADDWTRDMLHDGYPQLRTLYGLFGKTDHVQCSDLLQFPHNFNYVTRSVMYPWMNQHLGLGADAPIVEADFAVITDDDGLVWGEEHPQPTQVGVEHEKAVCQWMDAQAAAGLESWWPNSEDDSGDGSTKLRQAWRTILSLADSSLSALETAQLKRHSDKLGIDGVEVQTGLIRNAERGAAIPFASLRADDAANSPAAVVVWFRPGGKASLDSMTQEERDLVRQLLVSEREILVPDLFGQGELSVGGEADRQRVIADDRPFAAFTFGYNRTRMAEQVADAIDVIRYADSRSDSSVSILGTGDAAPASLAAIALSDTDVEAAAVLLDGFRFVHADTYRSPGFVPGSVKYGDVDALVALVSPHPLMLRDNAARSASSSTIEALPDDLAGLQRLDPAGDELPVKQLVAFLSTSRGQELPHSDGAVQK